MQRYVDWYFQDAIVVEYLGTQGWQAVGVLVGGFAVASAFITHKIWG